MTPHGICPSLPTERRYTWPNFEKLKEKNPHLLNFPKVLEPLAYIELNDAWLADMCEQVISYFKGVPDFSVHAYLF